MPPAGAKVTMLDRVVCSSAHTVLSSGTAVDTLQVQPSEEADVLSAGAFLLIQPVFNEGCTPDSAATSPLLLSLYLSFTQLQLIWLLPCR